MTRRRSILDHPALPLWGALWLAALAGLAVFVLPDRVIGRVLVASRLDALVPQLLPPLDLARHAAISLVTAVGAGLVGLAIFALIRRIARRRRHPEWAELAAELDLPAHEPEERVTRPLMVREELEDGFDTITPDAEIAGASEAAPPYPDARDPADADSDLATLVARFDRALDRFIGARSAPDRMDPVARPQGSHAELRAALAHLARSRED